MITTEDIKRQSMRREMEVMRGWKTSLSKQTSFLVPDVITGRGNEYLGSISEEREGGRSVA